jgi:hypothetical protein
VDPEPESLANRWYIVFGSIALALVGAALQATPEGSGRLLVVAFGMAAAVFAVLAHQCKPGAYKALGMFAVVVYTGAMFVPAVTASPDLSRG